MATLGREFFARSAEVVAPELLGAVWSVHGRRALITEVEAYTADDQASHSFRGRTARNSTMFGLPGRLYVYLIYGIHHCANFVTGPPGDGQAVLIRSVEVVGVPAAATRGPGRVCRELGIDRSDDGATVRVRAATTSDRPIVAGPRVGITKAADVPWRWRYAR